jgi:hypothetical protein
MAHPARRVLPNGPVGRKLQRFKCMSKASAYIYIPCNPGISLGSQGVKLCPPTGCAGVLYHLQGVFEPVYNRFSTTTTCPNDYSVRVTCPKTLAKALCSVLTHLGCP